MQALRIISEEHHNLWRIATTLDQIGHDLERGTPVETEFFESVFDYFEHYIDRNHHAKEDDFLFRVLAERCAEARPLIDQLEHEHRQGSASLQALRTMLTQAGRDPVAFRQALAEYTHYLKAHIATEERELMPLARRELLKSDWQDIDRAFLDHEDPVFGEEALAEFRELYHRIASLAPEGLGLGGHAAGALTADEKAPAVPAGDASVPGTASSADQARTLLSVRGLESCYGRIQALRGIDLEVREGELVALVGANGAGKTTFLRTVSGVQPMSAGRIQFMGDDISTLRADMRVRRGICQSPEGRQVFAPLSIEDNLRLGGYTQSGAQVEAGLARVWAMFPVLHEKRTLAAGTLSGGQQQMLAIGRALMARPKLLLLDEPSMGLAPLLVQEVFNVITTLRKQGMTILLVEQNAASALAIADRGYVMETGSVILQGTGQDLLADPEVKKAYLGM